MWLSIIGCSVSRFIDTGINVGSGNESKSVKDIRVNIDPKIGTKSQGWDRVHIHNQVQSH